MPQFGPSRPWLPCGASCCWKTKTCPSPCTCCDCWQCLQGCRVPSLPALHTELMLFASSIARGLLAALGLLFARGLGLSSRLTAFFLTAFLLHFLLATFVDFYHLLLSNLPVFTHGLQLMSSFLVFCFNLILRYCSRSTYQISSLWGLGPFSQTLDHPLDAQCRGLTAHGLKEL